jgi:hypothetical protein
MKRDGKEHKGGLVHRSSMSHKSKRSYGMGGEIAACGVKKVDGYSIHPARRLTTCPVCKKATERSIAEAEAEAKQSAV